MTPTCELITIVSLLALGPPDIWPPTPFPPCQHPEIQTDYTTWCDEECELVTEGFVPGWYCHEVCRDICHPVVECKPAPVTDFVACDWANMLNRLGLSEYRCEKLKGGGLQDHCWVKRWEYAE